MDTFIQSAHRITYTNAGSAISAGDVVVMGTLIGIAVADIAAGSGVGEVEIDGVHDLDAKTADAWVIGAQIYWDATNSELTDTEYANVAAGRAAEAKVATTMTAAKVVLNNNSPDVTAATTTAAPTTT